MRGLQLGKNGHDAILVVASFEESLKLFVPFSEFTDSLCTVRKTVLLFKAHLGKRLYAPRRSEDGVKPET